MDTEQLEALKRQALEIHVRMMVGRIISGMQVDSAIDALKRLPKARSVIRPFLPAGSLEPFQVKALNASPPPDALSEAQEPSSEFYEKLLSDIRQQNAEDDSEAAARRVVEERKRNAEAAKLKRAQQASQAAATRVAKLKQDLWDPFSNQDAELVCHKLTWSYRKSRFC